MVLVMQFAVQDFKVELESVSVEFLAARPRLRHNIILVSWISAVSEGNLQKIS